MATMELSGHMRLRNEGELLVLQVEIRDQKSAFDVGAYQAAPEWRDAKIEDFSRLRNPFCDFPQPPAGN